jgi:hypothetical protein
MRPPQHFIRRRIWRLRRLVVAQRFLRRGFIVQPLVKRHVIGVRLRPSDTRRIRRIRPFLGGAFFRQLSASKARTARSGEVFAFFLPVPPARA